jgi:hypothetical protein
LSQIPSPSCNVHIIKSVSNAWQRWRLLPLGVLFAFPDSHHFPRREVYRLLCLLAAEDGVLALLFFLCLPSFPCGPVALDTIHMPSTLSFISPSSEFYTRLSHYQIGLSTTVHRAPQLSPPMPSSPSVSLFQQMAASASGF